MLTYSWTTSSRTYCVIVFKKLDFRLWYGFVLLTIFSSYGPVIRTRWIISFLSYKIRVNPKTWNQIKSEIHLSTNKVLFLDVTVSLKHGKLRTTLFTKPIDSEFYLFISSCYPSHILKNLPKLQFIQLRRICSEKLDFFVNRKIIYERIKEHGFHEKKIKKEKRASDKNETNC